MLTVLSNAPAFDASALVRGRIENLTWAELFPGGWIVITFVSMNSENASINVLAAWQDAMDPPPPTGIHVVVIADQSVRELEASVGAAYPNALTFPIVGDHDGRIARQYDMLGKNETRLYGTYVVDPRGVIRRAEASSVPQPSQVDEIVTSVRSAWASV